MPDYLPWYPHSQASANSSYIALLPELTLQAFNIFLTISDSSKESGAVRTRRRPLSLAGAFPTINPPDRAYRERGKNSLLITDQHMSGETRTRMALCIAYSATFTRLSCPPLSTKLPQQILRMRAVGTRTHMASLHRLDKTPRRNPIHKRRVYLFRHARKGVVDRKPRRDFKLQIVLSFLGQYVTRSKCKCEAFAPNLAQHD